MTAARIPIASSVSDAWPVDISAEEHNALLVALEPRQLCAPLRAARRILRPFLVQLDAAGQEIGLSPDARRRVKRSVLIGMRRHGTAWGRWDAATWIAVASSAYDKVSILAVAVQLGAVQSRQLAAARVHPIHLARRLFGRALVEKELERIQTYLQTVGYGRTAGYRQCVPSALCHLFIHVGCANLDALTIDVVEAAHGAQPKRSMRRTGYFRIARVLHGMGILPRSLRHHSGNAYHPLAEIDPEWAACCERWRAMSTLAPTTVKTVYGCILRAGRWLARNHPEVRSPEDWTPLWVYIW